MGLLSSVATLLGLKPSAKTIAPEEQNPPVAEDPVITYQGTIASRDNRKTLEIFAKEGRAMAAVNPVEQPAVLAREASVQVPQSVLVNAKLINFNSSIPLTERGLRKCLLFPDKHRIYLKSRGQVRQFHGGEELCPIPDDLEIFTRE